MEATNDTFEIMLDVQKVSSDKAAIREKYGIKSNRIDDIKHILYGIANDIRRKRGTITDEDCVIFNRFWDVPESPKKLRIAMADESTEFIEYYLKRKKDIYRARPYDRTWQTSVRTLENIIQQRKNAKNVVLQKVIQVMKDQTSSYHDVLINKMMDMAERIFYRLKEDFGGIGDHMFDIINHFGDHGWDINQKNQTDVKRARTITFGYDFERYMEDQRQRAEREYDEKIRLLSERISTAGMDPDTIRVNGIQDDAKAFDIHVSDDTRSMHARSIWAAEYSTIVKPHFRFIITEE